MDESKTAKNTQYFEPVLNSYNLSSSDTKLVLTSCAFHDIGRRSELIDDGHGLYAAELVDRYVDFAGEDLKILKASIEAHSESDCLMDQIINKYLITDRTRALKLTCVIKDADSLDRVRISDLDPSYLRFKESLDLVGFANDLFWFYK